MAVRRVKVAVSVGFVAVLVATTTAVAGAVPDRRPAVQKPKGDPITIGVIYNEDEALGQSNEQVGDALDAAIDAAEKRGGLNGRPVRVEVCTNKANDPNGGAACANEMVENEDVVALVGSANSEGDAINPILEEAGIAAIGSAPIAAGDLTSAISFPISSGALGTAGAATILVDEFDVKKLALGNLDLAAAAQLPVIFNLALKERGLELAGEVKLPLEKQDLSAEAAQLADEGDGIIVMSLPEQFGRVVRAGQTTGTWEDKLVSSASSILTADVLESLGSEANGIYVATGGLATTDIKAPGVRKYLKEIKKYGDISTAQDDLVKNAWLAFQVFSAAVDGQATIDRASVLDAMGTLTYDAKGLAPPLDFSKPNTTLLGGAVARAFNTTVMYGKVNKKGDIVSVNREFVDPFVAPSG
jgi:ABC-type branched-subunit amino acid transport system substrate-binding protein